MSWNPKERERICAQSSEDLAVTYSPETLAFNWQQALRQVDEWVASYDRWERSFERNNSAGLAAARYVATLLNGTGHKRKMIRADELRAVFREALAVSGPQRAFTGTVVAVEFSDGRPAKMCGDDCCECPEHEYARHPGTYLVIKLDPQHEDDSFGMAQVVVTEVQGGDPR